MEMEDYLYEKKKKFEMMKKRNLAKKNNLNSNDLKLQTRQCEKNILKTYDFKTKGNEPMKQKVMLKKKQSTEKSLAFNSSVDDESCFTNTIYLQEDEFSLDKMKNTNLVNSNIQNSDETINNNENDDIIKIDDIIISKRDSSLNFQNLATFESSSIEIASTLHDSVSFKDGSSGGLSQNQRQNSNYTISESGKLQKKKSFSSFLQKQTSGILKKVKSLIQNSDDDTMSRTLSTNNSIVDVDTDSKSKKKSKNKSKDKNSNSDDKSSIVTEEGIAPIRSHKKTFSINSFRLKKSKSNISIDNDQNSTISTETPKKPLTRKGSVAKSIMRKISSLSRINAGSRKNSSNSINRDSDDSDSEKKFSVGKLLLYKKFDIYIIFLYRKFYIDVKKNNIIISFSFLFFLFFQHKNNNN